MKRQPRRHQTRELSRLSSSVLRRDRLDRSASPKRHISPSVSDDWFAWVAADGDESPYPETDARRDELAPLDAEVSRRMVARNAPAVRARALDLLLRNAQLRASYEADREHMAQRDAQGNGSDYDDHMAIALASACHRARTSETDALLALADVLDALTHGTAAHDGHQLAHLLSLAGHEPDALDTGGPPGNQPAALPTSPRTAVVTLCAAPCAPGTGSPAVAA